MESARTERELLALKGVGEGLVRGRTFSDAESRLDLSLTNDTGVALALDSLHLGFDVYSIDTSGKCVFACVSCTSHVSKSVAWKRSIP